MSKIKLYIVYIFLLLFVFFEIYNTYIIHARTLCLNAVTLELCVYVCVFSTLRHVCFPIGFWISCAHTARKARWRRQWRRWRWQRLYGLNVLRKLKQKPKQKQPTNKPKPTSTTTTASAATIKSTAQRRRWRQRREHQWCCSADGDDDNVRLSSRVPFVHCGTIFWTPLCGAALSRVRCLCSAKAERTALATLWELLLLASQISMGSIKCIYNALKKAQKLHSSVLDYDIPTYV